MKNIFVVIFIPTFAILSSCCVGYHCKDCSPFDPIAIEFQQDGANSYNSAELNAMLFHKRDKNTDTIISTDSVFTNFIINEINYNYEIRNSNDPSLSYLIKNISRKTKATSSRCCSCQKVTSYSFTCNGKQIELTEVIEHEFPFTLSKP